MNKFARRYHWIYDDKNKVGEYNLKDITLEPNRDIDGSIESEVLDMTSRKSIGARETSLDILRKDEINYAINQISNQIESLVMPSHHFITKNDLSERTLKELKNLSKLDISSYEDLVSLRGVGPKTIRALALISELVYGEKPSWEDPVKFSFAHGGKDGIPYKINKNDYDETIYSLKNIIEKSKLNKKENILSRLFNIKEIINFEIVD